MRSFQPVRIARPHVHPVLLLLPGLVSAVLAGCASEQPTAPAVLLSASLDRAEYKIGEPVIVAVRIENRSSTVVDIPRFDPNSLTFVVGTKDLGARIHREPVYSESVAPEPRHLRPGDAAERRFLFTRMTENEGEYGLLTGFKGIMQDGRLIEETVYAPPAPFTVTREIAFRRDPANGLILKEQAVELAKHAAGPDVKDARAVLVPRGESGLFTWVVFLTVQPAGGPERKVSLEVDPYTGKVRPVEARTDASTSGGVKPAPEAKRKDGGGK